MAGKAKKNRTPLFHIVKRDQTATTWKHRMLVRAIAVLAALLVSGALITLLSGKNPIEVYGSMIAGTFGTSRRIWNMLQNIGQLFI